MHVYMLIYLYAYILAYNSICILYINIYKYIIKKYIIYKRVTTLYRVVETIYNIRLLLTVIIYMLVIQAYSIICIYTSLFYSIRL